MPQGRHEKRQDLVLDNIPLLSFMKRCGENFREILGGRKDPRQVMFPGGNPDAVESIYQDTPQSRYYNGIMARSLKALADALPMDRALSILEIGAGTGGTTSALLPVLPAGRTRYVYTDVSPLFTARARDRFAAFPFVEYATLDISRDPFLQGFHADEFDIVVCANVLHATADLTAALRHISAVLAADGLLLLREITLPRPAMGFEISFGCLLDKLRDGELRGDNPFLTAEGWTRLLDTEGFDRTACYPAPADGDLDEHVIIARNGNGSRQAFSTGIAPARTAAPDGDDTGHILLGRRLSSPLAVSQYTAAVSGTLQPFLAQHRVFDIVVVPGTAHFDLAAAAGMDHFGTDRIRLENVVLREALMLDEGERTVQVLVSPTENGADFEIFSRGAGQGQGEWHQHVSGQLAPAHERSAENVDLDRLREGCDEVDVQAFYEKFDAYGAVQYGPAFRSLRRLWRTRGGAVAEVALDSAERGKKGGFIIHPALLDSCLQSMVAALAATEDDLTGDGFMPFSVEKVIFHGRAPETVWCRAVMKEGDSFRQEMFSASFTIFTPEGEPVCEIVNLTMRRTNKETLELLKAGQRQHTDLCYDVVWRQALMPGAGDAAGHWLILAGRDTDFARALARSLEQQGATSMLAACAGTELPDGMAAVDPGDADAFARLIRDWRQGGTPRGVVFLWGLDCYETDFLGSGGEAPFKNHTAQAFLHLAQALAAQEDGPSVRLAALTCQAQAARASDQPVPAQSLLWGLEKSVANELGNIAPVIIDMDPVAAPEAQLPTLCGLLTARGYKEDKLALRGGSLLAPRLVRGLPAARQVRNAPLARPETQAYHLDLGGAGIENIRVAPLQRRLPGPGEIEIAAEAYGMNFQNVMVAMGVADKIRTLVLDCAGTVSAVGEGVTRFSPGDRVFTTVYGPFASHVYAREAFAASIPEGMPFTDAAVIPTVFMTAWQALVHAARLQPGERVLLHSATGGVGLAAIQIARACGAVILATAGTERKRALLRSMGIEHVFSSRSTAFESRVLKATGGQGVHVVLNFLTGELADSSMRCLTEGGRFIEIGKTDLRTPTQVAAIRDDIEYHIVDLEKLGKEDEAQMRGIFAAVMEGFAAGHYTPIARRVFTMDAARDAFRYMLEGRHIGKVVVCNDFAPRHEGIRREAAYLVTGGLSDLGLALAAHLAARGAGQVWLLGRRLPEAGSAGAAAVEKIAATGCDVRLLQVDVTDRAALAEAFGTHLLPSPMPLAGVFHLAGLLDDAPLSRLDWARFNTVLSPKVDGSWFLHELTRDLALDHFVVFSSIASVFGTHGQANHVAANTFMDALVAARRADFLPGLSINWGAWGELGTVVRLGILDRIRQQGVEGFDTATGLAVLDRLMASGEGSKVVTRMDWNRMLPILQATAGAAMYEELRHSPAAAAARHGGNLLNDLAGVRALFKRFQTAHHKHACLAFVYGSKKRDCIRSGKLDVVAHNAQACGSNSVKLCADKAQTADFLCGSKQAFHTHLSKLVVKLLDFFILAFKLHHNRGGFLRNLADAVYFEVCGGFGKVGVHLVDIFKNAGAGDRFYSSYSGGNGGFADYLKQPYAACIGNMGAAAELDASSGNIHNADNIAVFFAKQRHCAHFLCFLDGAFAYIHIKGGKNHFVYNFFGFRNFFGGHCGKMAEVKAAAVLVNIGTRLMNMVAQNLAQCLLKKMAGGVVALGRHANRLGKACADGISGAENACAHGSYVHIKSGGGLFAVGNIKDGGSVGDCSSVADLTAHFRIKRRGIKDNNAVLALGNALYKLSVLEYRKNFCRRIHSVVSDKFCFYIAEGGKAVLHPGNAVCGSACVPCALLLLAHKGIEGFFINGNALVLKNILRKVKREAEGIVKAESNIAGKNLFARFLKLCNIVVEQLEALVDGAAEALFLGKDDLFDIIGVLHKLGISHLVFLNNRINNFINKRLVYSEKTAVACRTAQKALQNIASAVVCGHNAVGNHKGGAAHMVGDNAKGNIHCGVVVIFNSGNLAYLLHNILDGVHLKKVIHALHNAGKALHTHTGIYIRVLHALVMTLAVGIELGENKVPNLDKAVAFAADGAIGSSAAVLGAAVIVNFGAGAAGAGADFPEVIFFAEAVDMVLRNAYHIAPIIICLVILVINGDIKALLRKLHNLGKEFPRPGDGFFFEVIAEAEVAEHLKIGAVAVVLAHIVNIRRADALLAGCYPVAGGLLLPKEPFFHRRHAGVDKQKAFIVLRQKRKAGKAFVPLAFKKA